MRRLQVGIGGIPACGILRFAVLIAIQTPADNNRGPIQAEQFLNALHGALSDRSEVTLGFGCHADRVRLFCSFEDDLQQLIEQYLLGVYTDATIERLSDEAFDPTAGFVVQTRELNLVPDLFPIRRHQQFSDEASRSTSDPLTGVLALLHSTNTPLVQARIEISVRSASRSRVRLARFAVEKLASPYLRSRRSLARFYSEAVCSASSFRRWLAWFIGIRCCGNFQIPRADPLAISASRLHDREDHLQAAANKLGGRLFETRLRISVASRLQDVAAARGSLRDLTVSFGQFHSLASFRPADGRHRPFLCSAEELASLWHPPLASVRTPRRDTTGSRMLEAPAGVPLRKREVVASLGHLHFRERRDVFGIRQDDRFRHIAITGKTGMGKSTLLQNLIVSDMRNGHGICVIDPHGDLAETIASLVPRRRTGDVVLFDAGDREFPLGFNPLMTGSPDQRSHVASGVLTAFRKLHRDSWGPRMEHILRNAILLLLETPGTSLVSLMRLFTDGDFRCHLTDRCRDPAVRAFWIGEFGVWNERYRTEAIAPIQNKVGQFVTQPLLRNIIGQPTSTVNLRHIMDEGKILIVNLSKGRTGEDVSSLLGSLLVSSLQIAALSRAEQPECERRPFFVYVDEFQNFATESFATILSEARKYRLGLTIANQYLDQLDDGTREAVFGNVGSLITFQVGAGDAGVLSEQLAGDVRSEDLIGLPRHTAYVRLLIDGMPSRPFSMQTLPPPVVNPLSLRMERVRHHSRRQFGRSYQEVNRIIAGQLAT